jgi:toxin YxiD
LEIITLGSFDTTKALYQGMDDRAHVAMNSPYDFVNYLSMGTLDLGNGAINPDESFSKEHWLSSIGLASILAGGAKPVILKPQTPSLQNKNLILESTVLKAHELTLKTRADVNVFMGEIRGGINVILNPDRNDNFAYSYDVYVKKIPKNVMDTESVKRVIEEVLSKFSLDNKLGKSKYTTGTMKHIYHGEINKRGKAVGYHHESMMGGKIISGTEEKPDINGVYRAKVEIDGVKKIAKSTFLPKEWDRAKVINTINEAYETKIKIGNNKYVGKTSSGIDVEMYLNYDGKIVTAYPLFKK